MGIIRSFRKKSILEIFVNFYTRTFNDTIYVKFVFVNFFVKFYELDSLFDDIQI